MYCVHFCVPGPPVGKARPRVTKSGHAYTPQKTKDYERLVQACYLSQVGSFCYPGKKPLEVVIEAEFPIPKSASKKRTAEMEETYHTNKPDGDNVAKAILDALNGLAGRQRGFGADGGENLVDFPLRLCSCPGNPVGKTGSELPEAALEKGGG